MRTKISRVCVFFNTPNTVFAKYELTPNTEADFKCVNIIMIFDVNHIKPRR